MRPAGNGYPLGMATPRKVPLSEKPLPPAGTPPLPPGTQAPAPAAEQPVTRPGPASLLGKPRQEPPEPTTDPLLGRPAALEKLIGALLALPEQIEAAVRPPTAQPPVAPTQPPLSDAERKELQKQFGKQAAAIERLLQLHGVLPTPGPAAPPQTDPALLAVLGDIKEAAEEALPTAKEILQATRVTARTVIPGAVLPQGPPTGPAPVVPPPTVPLGPVGPNLPPHGREMLGFDPAAHSAMLRLAVALEGFTQTAKDVAARAGAVAGPPRLPPPGPVQPPAAPGTAMMPWQPRPVEPPTLRPLPEGRSLREILDEMHRPQVPAVVPAAPAGSAVAPTTAPGVLGPVQPPRVTARIIYPSALPAGSIPPVGPVGTIPGAMPFTSNVRAQVGAIVPGLQAGGATGAANVASGFAAGGPIGAITAAAQELKQTVLGTIDTVGKFGGAIAAVDAAGFSRELVEASKKLPIFGEYLGAAGGALMSITSGLDRTVDRLSAYSPQLAVARATAEVRDIMRDIQRAQRLGPELADLVVAQQRGKEKMEDALEKLTTKLIPIVTVLMEHGATIVDLLSAAGETASVTANAGIEAARHSYWNPALLLLGVAAHAMQNTERNTRRDAPAEGDLFGELFAGAARLREQINAGALQPDRPAPGGAGGGFPGL